MSGMSLQSRRRKKIFPLIMANQAQDTATTPKPSDECGSIFRYWNVNDMIMYSKLR